MRRLLFPRFVPSKARVFCGLSWTNLSLPQLVFESTVEGLFQSESAVTYLDLPGSSVSGPLQLIAAYLHFLIWHDK